MNKPRVKNYPKHKGNLTEEQVMRYIGKRRFREISIQTFMMYFVDGMSLTEIANERGITRQGVYMTISRL